MKTFLVQITREFEIEVEATDKAEALEVALERFEDDATETVTVDELAD
jgi:Ca2+-binding EF-hand superfamily protein